MLYSTHTYDDMSNGKSNFLQNYCYQGDWKCRTGYFTTSILESRKCSTGNMRKTRCLLRRTFDQRCHQKGAKVKVFRRTSYFDHTWCPCTNLAERDPPPSKMPYFQSIFSRSASAITSDKKVQLTLTVHSTGQHRQQAIQWVYDEQHTY